MRLSSVDILNFKNIAEARLDFSDGVNCLLGRNGMGKSNLLAAIHFMCMARPMSRIPESSLIRHGEEMLSVAGQFSMDSGVTEKVNIGIVRSKGKSLRRNGKEYDRISRHIGAFPIVCVTPRDSELVTGAAEERRRLMDMVISQADQSYLSQLIRYNRSLDSRNRMLRAGVRDQILYESVETVMAEASEAVNRIRRQWTDRISPEIARFYHAIAGEGESVSTSYSSVLNDTTLPDELKRTRGKDMALGFTSSGIHRDDLSMQLDGYSLRRLGSQGQIKTFTVALRLAVFNFLMATAGETPLLLLDDIFDKLDSLRVGRIMQLVSHTTGFGQIFITDTNREHLDETLACLEGGRRLIEVSDGTFTPIWNDLPQ